MSLKDLLDDIATNRKLKQTGKVVPTTKVTTTISHNKVGGQRTETFTPYTESASGFDEYHTVVRVDKE